MLTTFYFDDELFQDDLLADRNLNHNVLLEYWENYGCFCYSEQSIASINNSLRSITPKYKQKWVAALSDFTKKTVELNKCQISLYEDYEELDCSFIGKKINVALIASAYEDLYPIEVINGITEVLKIDDIFSSQYFNDSKINCELDIHDGDSISDIWESRFKELSFHTKKITVIDRYLISNSVKDDKDRKITSLEKFIKFLSNNNKDVFVNVYSGCDISGDITNFTEVKCLIEKIKEKPFFKKNLMKLNVTLCKNSIFSEAAHDRMIKFDNHVVQIGSGFEIFRDKKVCNTTFNIKNNRSTVFDKTYAFLSKNKEKDFKNI